MRALLFSDLHIGLRGVEKLEMITKINATPDAVILCGDNAEVTKDLFYHQVLFQLVQKKFQCPVGFICGNHDLYGKRINESVEEMLFEHYPRLAKHTGVIYLEQENLRVQDCTFSGTYAHYDYSFSSVFDRNDLRTGRTIIGKREHIWVDKEEMLLQETDEGLCHRLLDAWESRLSGENLITISHTVPSLKLNAWRKSPANEFLICYSGAAGIEKIIRKYQPAFHFCGHTHKYARARMGKTDVRNISGHYDILTYIELDTQNKTVKRYSQKVKKDSSA
jgi:Icc-related predicted phosphoesterase